MTDLDVQVMHDGSGEREDRGPFGAWAPGVLEEFLMSTLGDRSATSAGAIVGNMQDHGLMIDGIITTVERGSTGAVAFDRSRWGWVHEARGTHYPDSTLIGWYCSRPNVGAVPTEVDAKTHDQFFPGGGFLLICVDPAAAKIAAYLSNEDGAMVSVGSGDLNELMGLEPIASRKLGITRAMVGASVAGCACGLAAWFAAGAGGWPFG